MKKTALNFSAFVTALLLFGALTISACKTINPVTAAETPEQRAYAVYGTFVVAEELGAKIVTDATTPASVKQAIKDADAKAKPAADALLDATQQVMTVRAQLAAGATTEDKLKTVIANLDTWITDASPKVSALLKAVTGGK